MAVTPFDCHIRRPDAAHKLYLFLFVLHIEVLHCGNGVLDHFLLQPRPWAFLLRCDLYIWFCVLNIWHFVVYWLWDAQALYQILAKLCYVHWCCCDFSIWANDIEHVPHIALHSVKIFTKFGQLIHSWLIRITAHTICDAATLTFDPVTLNVCHIIKLCTIFDINGTIHGWLIETYKFTTCRADLRLLSVHDLRELISDISKITKSTAVLWIF